MWWIGNILRRLFVLGLLVVGGLALYTQYAFQEPFYDTWSRMLRPQIAWQREQRPSLDPVLNVIEPLLSKKAPRDHFGVVPGNPPVARPSNWKSTVVGPRRTEGREDAYPANRTVLVGSAAELTNAIGKATPGTVITLTAGDYSFSGHSIEIRESGTPDRPIIVRGLSLGAAKLHFNMLEGFHVQGSNWIFENLQIDGTCSRDKKCEHAFHVTGPATGIVIRNNWVSNFNAPVKVNGTPKGFPDRGTILNNAFVNDRPRETDRPVTLLDIVGVRNWDVEGNFIADFAKAEGNHTSYGVFFKGDGSDNIFERNLIRCEWRLRGGTRIGFSFGGGGTGLSFCRDGKCRVEHTRGIMRSNVVMNCPNDVGVYLNKSKDTLIYNNLIIKTRGIDVRYDGSSAKIFNNVIDGRILARQGGTYTEQHNAISTWDAVLDRDISDSLFAAPQIGDLRATAPDRLVGMGEPLAEPARDFCGLPYPRGSAPIGPFQYGPNIGCQPLMPPPGRTP